MAFINSKKSWNAKCTFYLVFSDIPTYLEQNPLYSTLFITPFIFYEKCFHIPNSRLIVKFHFKSYPNRLM